MTWLALGLVVVLLAAHEALAVVATRRRGSRGVWLARAGVLALLLLAVAAFTVRASLGQRVAALAEAMQERQTRPVAFDAGGDPLLAGVLTGQTPARPYPADGTADDVAAWRRAIVEQLTERIDYQAAAALRAAPETVGVETVDGVRRTLIRYTSWDGTRIPAYVLEPLSGAAGSGVLVVPGHGDGIRATAGLVRDYQHAAALALAQAGHITLTSELRGFGLLTPDGEPRHRAVAAAALEAGSFYKAAVVKDLAVGLTVLSAWPGVDPERVAATGASLGGELAVFLGVLDPRVRAVASHSYGGAVGPIDAETGVTDDERQTPHGCHTIPGINQLLWQEDWFRLLAPRPVLLVRGTRNTPRESQRLADAVGRTYAAVGAPGGFRFEAVAGGHEYYVEASTHFLETTSWPPRSPRSGS